MKCLYNILRVAEVSNSDNKDYRENGLNNVDKNHDLNHIM